MNDPTELRLRFATLCGMAVGAMRDGYPDEAAGYIARAANLINLSQRANKRRSA